MFIFGFGFQNNKGEPLVVQQQEIDKPIPALLEIFPHFIHLVLADLYMVLQDDIRPATGIIEEPPAGFLE